MPCICHVGKHCRNKAAAKKVNIIPLHALNNFPDSYPSVRRARSSLKTGSPFSVFFPAITNMTTQFRNTQFGHLVRFLSGDKLFRYPDEIDPSLWWKSVRRDTRSTLPPSGEQSSISEKRSDADDSNDDSSTQLEAQEGDEQNQSTNDVSQHSKDVFLVDWYSPTDPEVPSLPLSPHTAPAF